MSARRRLQQCAPQAKGIKRAVSGHGRLALALVALAPVLALATPPLEWSLHDGQDLGYRLDQDINVSHRIAPPWPREYMFAANYNYFYELREIAAFLQVWQEGDPSSPDFGGMIEAEAGDLADVIQTDNTLEAIIAWSRYAVVFSDTATYGENIRRAWGYCWRYPAWREEGDPGDDYYRNHNCAWGLWAVLAYQEAYGDPQHAAYADTSAAYMVDHPMSFSAPGAYRWINPFVTGWMAGNLYLYGEAVGNSALADTAVGMGNRVKEWIEADPATRLSEERWAMSSGTAVWGVCNSVFRADPAQGATWVAAYGPLVDTFQPWRNAPDDGYDWDNAWNVAYTNAHHAMYLLSDDDQYGANFQALADTLLSYDTDEDGGIPATTQDPPTEDMTWISSYLWLMGVYNLAAHLPEIDAGVLDLTAVAQRPPFHIGDSLIAACTFANFGASSLASVNITVRLVAPSGLAVEVSQSSTLDLGENLEVSAVWPVAESGMYRLNASAECAGDENSANDTLFVLFDVLPVVQVEGQLVSMLSGGPLSGRITAAYLVEGMDPMPYDTSWADPADGEWLMELPSGSYHLSVHPRLPYPEYAETLVVGSTPVQRIIAFDHVADLVLIDDDDGQNLESFVVESCDTLALDVRLWDRTIEPVPSAAHVLEFPTVPLIWLTGEATTQALESAEQDTLLLFLQGGGMLLLTGQNAVEYCGDGVLFQQMIPVSFGSNSFDHILDLDPTDPFNAGYEHIGTAGFGSANNQRSQDVLITGTVPGVELFPFVSYSEGQIAGVRLDGAGGRRIMLGFGIEGVGLPSQPQGFMPRHVLLARCLSWLSGAAGSPSRETSLPSRPVLVVGPNPCQGVMTVTYWSPAGPLSVPFSIYDMSGRRVAGARLECLTDYVRTTFDASDLPAGLYVCRAGAAAPTDLVILR